MESLGAVTPEPTPLATGIFKFVVFKDPKWDYKTFDFDRDTKLSAQLASASDAIDPNLSRFSIAEESCSSITGGPIEASRR